MSLRALLGQNTTEFRGRLVHLEERLRLMTLISRERFDSLERQLSTNSGIGTLSPNISNTSPNMPVFDMSRMSLESPSTAGPSEDGIGLTTSRGELRFVNEHVPLTTQLYLQHHHLILPATWNMCRSSSTSLYPGFRVPLRHVAHRSHTRSS